MPARWRDTLKRHNQRPIILDNNTLKNHEGWSDENRKAVELNPFSKEHLRGSERMMNLARIYVMVGEHEEALELIELLLSNPGVLSTGLLQIEPIWKPLENNPEFIELLETYSEN